ncbi:FecR family protein [Mucilaginibacter sp. SP1R1]|uniref:FecR family protein n=1 Tax=Mucilaginibacter sp. SP1R1 TaxID=2723091 RepID=UPI00160E0F02|nr:FecR family protein [Mucilaginibacter sp. SP1R1]MBB6151770.1 ferric-dicitrate binding protein FerR (iron transport regulator) [Mucilaginibacter sp. SP1R1]
MEKNISVEVIERYLSGNCTPDEIKEVYQWFRSFDSTPESLVGLSNDEKDFVKEKLFAQIISEIGNGDNVVQFDVNTVRQQQLLEEANPAEQNVGGKTYRLWPKIAIAASIMLMICFSLYSVLTRDKVVPETVKTQLHDIRPGGNNAVLTLADGSTIILNNAKKGLLTRQGNVKVSKTTEGLLVYKAGIDNAIPGNTKLNTINTPKGGQYEVILPDGTKVWLNALSHLRFPTSFSGNTRLVEISGEAYFEVAKNPAKPFIVKSTRAEVTVLGTHFNVNDYPDEAFSKTTLLEGSVKIKGKQAVGTLKPGEQALLNERDEMKIAVDVNVEEAVAWKNGIFEFNRADITSIMRQAARWYDINVIYAGAPTHILYKGRISRNVNLSEMLTMIKYMGVNYTLDGKNLTIKD